MDLNQLGSLVKSTVGAGLQTVDKYVPGASSKIKNMADKAKAYYNNMTDLELKVMEATNHEPWGPHGQAMSGGLRGELVAAQAPVEELDMIDGAVVGVT